MIEIDQQKEMLRRRELWKKCILGKISKEEYIKRLCKHLPGALSFPESEGGELSLCLK